MSTGFSAEQKAGILMRDGERCCMCGGKATEANHRANRGAGGRQSKNTTANGCAIDWICNGAIEADALYGAYARYLGVKLSDHEDPETTPYWSPFWRLWVQPHGDEATLLTLDPPLSFDDWRVAG